MSGGAKQISCAGAASGTSRVSETNGAAAEGPGVADTDGAAIRGPQWVSSADPGYPDRLRGIPVEPEGLWLRSSFSPSRIAKRIWATPAVAIVGARAASPAGLEISRTLAWGLARAGILVVSGLARGIDGAAHEGALLAGGRTVAVLACGLDLCYPPEHAGLADEIARNGLLLSEWPEGTPASAWRFPHRNRLISGIADIVILVEAEARSGAHHTARFAIEQGREVMAVPRDPILPGSIGPNRLIQDGAAPAIDSWDVIHALEGLGKRTDPGPARDRRCGCGADSGLPVRPWERESATSGASQSYRDTGDRCGGTQARLLSVLARSGSLGVEEVVSRMPHTPPSVVMSELVALEVEGRIRRDRAGRLRLHAGC